MNIIMIGMPGCGKSTVGVLLAKALRYGFVDCDLIIQKRCAMSLQDIIDRRGLEAFLAEEESAICSLEEDGAVIATGGSAVYSQRAMEHLRENAVVLYLRLPLEEIEARLTNIKTRGVAMEKGSTIADLYAQRTPLYEKYADIVLDAGGMDIEDTVAKAVELIGQYTGKASD